MNTHFDKKTLVLALLTAAAALPAVGTRAAEIEEVVVTAEKREQSIQEVPLSVAAISGDDVQVGKVTGLNDVAYKTPGLHFNQFNIGEPRVYIRGIGNSSDSAASDQAVGVFLDEVYIGRTGGVGFDLFDLERIEILRGPQGTLYGKNTNGGAINIVTARPSQDDEIKLSGSLGSDDLQHVQALLNGGLSESIAGKLVVSYKQRDGYGKNVITPEEIDTLGNLQNSPIIGASIGAAGAGDELDDAENLSVRSQVLFDLTESTSLLLGADYAKDESNGACRHLENLDQAIQGLGTFWALGMSEKYRSDERHCASQFDTSQEREIRGALARLDMDLDWATFTSITAWRESEYDFVDDLTSLPLNDLDAPSPPGLRPPLSLPGVFTTPENVIDGVDEEASQVSQEFRLSGSYDALDLDWVGGLFYMEEDVERSEEFYTQYGTLLQALRLAPVGDVLFYQDNTTTSQAAYGQLDWHATEQITLTYGIRWTDDEKEITQDADDLLGVARPPTGVPLILPAFPAPVKADDSWSEVTHKVSASYSPTDDLMFYATYSEGFKSGAFPSQANVPANAGTSVDPETVDNVEVGMKSTWWDGRMQFNVSYYDMDYSDLQVFELNSRLLLVLGSAQAESKGYEVEFNVLATENLMFSSSYNYSDAEYTDYINANGVDVSGNEMVNAPDNAYAISADYHLGMGSAGALDFNLSYYWKDDYFTTPANVEKAMQEDVAMIDASVAWSSVDESWTVNVWGKNLDDETQLANLIVDPTGITSEMYLPPRTYGVTVTKAFRPQ